MSALLNMRQRIPSGFSSEAIGRAVDRLGLSLTGHLGPDAAANRVRDLVNGHATLSMVAEAMLVARETLFAECQKLETRLRYPRG
jgi:hypothetical protein